jgi:hypothetical protein
MTVSIMTLSTIKEHTQSNDIHHKDTQYHNKKHNSQHNCNQHKDTKYSNKNTNLSVIAFSIMTPSTAMKNGTRSLMAFSSKTHRITTKNYNQHFQHIDSQYKNKTMTISLLTFSIMTLSKTRCSVFFLIYIYA